MLGRLWLRLTGKTLSQTACSIGWHDWEYGDDGFGYARWCQECGKKQVLRADPVRRGDRLIAGNLRWCDEDEE